MVLIQVYTSTDNLCHSSPVNYSDCSGYGASAGLDLWGTLNNQTVCSELDCCDAWDYPDIWSQLFDNTTVNLTSTCTGCCVTTLFSTSGLTEDQANYFTEACEEYCHGSLVPFSDDPTSTYCQPSVCCQNPNSYDAGLPGSPRHTTSISDTRSLDVRKDSCLDCCTMSPYGEGQLAQLGMNIYVPDEDFVVRCRYQCSGIPFELAEPFSFFNLTWRYHCYQPACCDRRFYNPDRVTTSHGTFPFPIGNVTNACCPVGDYVDTNLTSYPSSVTFGSCVACCQTNLIVNITGLLPSAYAFHIHRCEVDCQGVFTPFADDSQRYYCQPSCGCMANSSYDIHIPETKNTTQINNQTGTLDVRKERCLDCCTQSLYDTGQPLRGGGYTANAVFENACKSQCGGQVVQFDIPINFYMEVLRFACYQPSCCGTLEYNPSEVAMTLYNFTGSYMGINRVAVGNITAACYSSAAPTLAPTKVPTEAPTTKAPTTQVLTTQVPTTRAPTGVPASAPTDTPRAWIDLPVRVATSWTLAVLGTYLVAGVFVVLV